MENEDKIIEISGAINNRFYYTTFGSYCYVIATYESGRTEKIRHHLNRFINPVEDKE